MSALFQPEITSLEAQLAALQAQIAAVQERRVALNKAEAVAENIVQAVRGGIEEFNQIAGITTDAIARVKQAVLDIFGGNPNNGNDGNGDNGNNPNPAPQPNDDGGVGEVVVVKVSADENTVAAAPMPTALDKLKVKLNRAYPWPTSPAVPHDAVATPESQEMGGVEAVSAVAIPEIEKIGEVAVASTSTPTESEKIGEVAVAIAVEALTGQFCEWASPWATPFASPVASWLCCQLEDAPQSALVGQAVDLAAITYSRDGFKYLDDATITVQPKVSPETPKKPEYIELIPVGHSVAYQRRYDGEIICTYLGGNNKHKLKLWGEWLCHQHTVGSGFQLRDPERLTAFTYEIKIWGMSLAQIQRLAESNTTKNPPSNYGAAPKRKLEKAAPPAYPSIEVGDIVASQLVPDWQYEVIEVLDNGALNGRLIGVEPAKIFPLNVASVNLVSKAEKHIVTADQSKSDRREDSPVAPTTDWKALAQELGVSIDQLELGHYRAYYKGFRKLGEVIQKWDENNNSWWVNRNQKSLLSVGNGDGQSYSDPHEAAIGLAKFLKVIKDAEESKADLNGTWDEPTAPQAQPTETPKSDNLTDLAQQEIQIKDWVELLATGNTYEVTNIDGDELHLLAGSESLVVHPWEVKLVFRVPADWQPFAAPMNSQSF